MGEYFMDVTIELTAEERTIVEKYAQKHNFSLEEAFKNGLFKRIKGEYARIMINEADDEYVEGIKKESFY